MQFVCTVNLYLCTNNNKKTHKHGTDKSQELQEI